MRKDLFDLIGYTLILTTTLLVPAAFFAGELRGDVMRSVVMISGAYAVALFVAVILDGDVHRAVVSANHKRNDGGMFGLRSAPHNDPAWGLLGSRLGGGPLGFLRGALFVEFWACLFTFGLYSEVCLAAIVGFAISILLTLRALGRFGA